MLRAWLLRGTFSRARLAVCEEERVAMDLGPAEAQDLTLAASGEQKKANDIRLLPIVLSGLVRPEPGADDRSPHATGSG